MRTEITKKMAKSLAGTDDTRPALKGLYLDTNKSTLTSCNSHAVINYKVKIDSDDNSAILPIDLLKTKLKEKCEYSINGVAVRNNYTSKSEYRLIDAKYPDIDSVTPEDDTEDRVIGIDLELLKKLYDAVPKDENGKKYVSFRIPKNPLTVIKFKQDANIPAYDGLIMPIKLTEE